MRDLIIFLELCGISAIGLAVIMFVTYLMMTFRSFADGVERHITEIMDRDQEESDNE